MSPSGIAAATLAPLLGVDLAEASGGLPVVGVEVASPDPAGSAARFGQALGREPYRASGTLVIALDGGRIRFVPGEGEERLAGVDLAAPNTGATAPEGLVRLDGVHVRVLPAERSEEEVVAETVRDYSDMFARALHARDPALMRPYCHVPALHLGPQGVRLVASDEEHDASWAAAHDGLRPLDYDHSVLHTVDVRLLNEATALVEVDCSRYDAGGGEIVRFPAAYLATRTPEGWKICTWIAR